MKKSLLSKVSELKELWGQGFEGQEAREFLQLTPGQYKRILKYLDIEDDFEIKNIWKKFLAKQQIRYLQVMKLKEMAESLAQPDLPTVRECIKLLIEIDNNIIKVGQSLGIIYRSPETFELKAPPEVMKIQQELKELEVEYLKLTKRYEDKSENERISPEGFGEADSRDKAEIIGGEEKALTENVSILAPRTQSQATSLLSASLQPTES